MRILKLHLIGAAILLVTLTATETKANPPDSQVKAELVALVESWIDAEVHDDRETMENIFHEDFLSTFASGTTLNRTEYIDFIVGLDISPFNVTNEAMRVFDDTAVVIDVSEDGKTKFTWIAIRENERWRVISQTFSNLE